MAQRWSDQDDWNSQDSTRYSQELIKHVRKGDRQEACEEANDCAAYVLEPLPLPGVFCHLHEKEPLYYFVGWVNRQRIRKDEVDTKQQPCDLDEWVRLVQVLDHERFVFGHGAEITVAQKPKR